MPTSGEVATTTLLVGYSISRKPKALSHTEGQKKKKEIVKQRQQRK